MHDSCSTIWFFLIKYSTDVFLHPAGVLLSLGFSRHPLSLPVSVTVWSGRFTFVSDDTALDTPLHGTLFRDNTPPTTLFHNDTRFHYSGRESSIMEASCFIPLAMSVSFWVVSLIAAVRVALRDVDGPCTCRLRSDLLLDIKVDYNKTVTVWVLPPFRALPPLSPNVTS